MVSLWVVYQDGTAGNVMETNTNTCVMTSAVTMLCGILSTSKFYLGSGLGVYIRLDQRSRLTMSLSCSCRDSNPYIHDVMVILWRFVAWKLIAVPGRGWHVTCRVKDFQSDKWFMIVLVLCCAVFCQPQILPGVWVTWTWPLFSSPRSCEDTCNHGAGQGVGGAGGGGSS